MKPYITVTSDFTKEFNDIINKFKHDVVLVGIPEEDTTRKKKSEATRSEEPITNAAILAINNFGSPVNNIPPWPVMSIGIRAAQDEIADQFKAAAINTLKVGLPALDTYYNRIGIIAANSIKQTINDQEGAPDLAESTLRARKYRNFKGTKRLIVTGQMRNAITYVVRGG